jgi:hypothetical protein
MRATTRRAGKQSHALAKRLSRAPLHRAVAVAHGLACGDEVAARQAERDRIGLLADERDRVHLVELAHAVGDAATDDEREAAQRAADQLEVRRFDGRADADRFVRMPQRQIRPAVVEQREDAFAQTQPRARAIGQSVEQLFEKLAPNLGETAFLSWVFRDLGSSAGGLPELFAPQPAEIALPADARSRALKTVSAWSSHQAARPRPSNASAESGCRTTIA